jgi:single-strand DNA-binding protein
MNNVSLSGNLCKDIVVRYTPNDVAVLSNTLAVKRDFKNKEGEYESDFINIVVFKHSAKYLESYAKKGTQIELTGRIQTRNYENNDGNKVYITETICSNVSITEKKEKQQDDEHKQYDNSKQNIPEHLKPNHEKSEDPFFASSNIDIDEDDLPF